MRGSNEKELDTLTRSPLSRLPPASSTYSVKDSSPAVSFLDCKYPSISHSSQVYNSSLFHNYQSKQSFQPSTAIGAPGTTLPQQAQIDLKQPAVPPLAARVGGCQLTSRVRSDLLDHLTIRPSQMTALTNIWLNYQ